MSIEVNFSKYQNIWDDCCLGYILIDNDSGLLGLEAIQDLIKRDGQFSFYPWLRLTEQIIYPEDGLNVLCPREFGDLFTQMAKDAIAHGSGDPLSEQEIDMLLSSFLDEFVEPKFFSNFTKSGWSSVTNHSRDSLLCVADENKIGMWLSFDDE